MNIVQREFRSFDGATLAYHVIGEGPLVVLLHGFLSDGRYGWVQTGVAPALAEAGFCAVALDMRAHGASSAPEDARFYPPDVLAQDAEMLLQHLDPPRYDLVGYSLGGRTAVRMLVRGARPRRCVIGGMGHRAVRDWTGGAGVFFEDTLINGDRGAFPQGGKTVAGLMARQGLNATAMLNISRAQPPTPLETLKNISTPILTIMGTEDGDTGSAEKLAAAFPNGRALRTPGHHISAIGAPEFRAAIVEFLR